MWKCGNVEICLHCLNLSNNSGSVEMWKYVFIVLIYLITLEAWKCGNVEMWKYVFFVFVSKLWKCGNLEMWKCGNMSSLSLSN